MDIFNVSIHRKEQIDLFVGIKPLICIHVSGKRKFVLYKGDELFHHIKKDPGCIMTLDTIGYVSEGK